MSDTVTFVDEDALDEPVSTASTSVLDALKAQRAKLAETQTFDVDVPGWRGLLVLRLGSITQQQQQRIGVRVQQRNATPDLDFLVAAFREVLGRARSSDALELLVDSDGDPIGLDERLAVALDLGVVTSARDVLQRLFAGANSPTLAIASAANDWLEWARSANSEIDEDFLGE